MTATNCESPKYLTATQKRIPISTGKGTATIVTWDVQEADLHGSKTMVWVMTVRPDLPVHYDIGAAYLKVQELVRDEMRPVRVEHYAIAPEHANRPLSRLLGLKGNQIVLFMPIGAGLRDLEGYAGQLKRDASKVLDEAQGRRHSVYRRATEKAARLREEADRILGLRFA
jgi:hypothetical protein